MRHGLPEAAYCGNTKSLPMLRGYYDWFNRQAFLPDMLRGAIQGGQGMVANTRVCLNPIGEAGDAQLIQRYYQEAAWLNGLAKREKEQVWQYPYDRPHCYLLTNPEACLDMYLITGEPRYHNAVLGAWNCIASIGSRLVDAFLSSSSRRIPQTATISTRSLENCAGAAFGYFSVSASSSYPQTMSAMQLKLKSRFTTLEWPTRTLALAFDTTPSWRARRKDRRTRIRAAKDKEPGYLALCRSISIPSLPTDPM
jgi:hypothetical protein